MRISIVVIVAENGAIGKDNALLWRLPDDMKHFKTITMGKPIVMGRKTFDSVGRSLPGRFNIVVSRQANLTIPGCVVVDSLSDAIQAARTQHAHQSQEPAEIMIIGGAEIYRQALPLANTIYLTQVHASVPGDVYFPALPSLLESRWQVIQREDHAADERHVHAFSFITLERNE
jgi:dihydrofolate reductase